MPTTEEQVRITLRVPRSVADRVGASAQQADRTIEQEAEALLELGLQRREKLRRSLEKARAAYEAELERTGTRRPTTDELWEQMRRIREEVASELYPD